MGVHDFSDAIYSRDGKEGDQCLEILPKANNPFLNNDMLVEDIIGGDDAISDDDFEEIWDNKLKETSIPNPIEIYVEVFQDGPFDGVGTGEAVLEIFVFPLNVNVSRENFNDMVNKKKYIDRYFEPFSYSWDGWDFYKGDEENWMNYNSFADTDMPIVWKVEETDENTPYILDKHKGFQVWIRNFSKHAYDFYVNANTVSPNLTNLDLAYVAYLFGIDYRKKSRTTVFNEIKNEMACEFGFEVPTNATVKAPPTKKPLKFVLKKPIVPEEKPKKTITLISKKPIVTSTPSVDTPKTTAKKQCSGSTKSGDQCKREIKVTETYCYQHKK